MGCYTTFTISNDGLDNLLREGEEFSRKLYEAAVGGGKTQITHGNYGGLVNVKRVIHGSENVIYMSKHGTLYEMNAYSRETVELMQKDPEYFKGMLDYMDNTVKELKSEFKKYNPTVHIKKEKK